jgi:hypothetical protein
VKKIETKKATKKLELAKESILRLLDGQLAGVAGGTVIDPWKTGYCTIKCRP